METNKRLKKMLFRIRMKMRVRWFWRGILCFIGRYQKPREIIWEDSYGGKIPACPRCGELVYYTDMCCFCGQRLKDGVPVGKVMEQHEC